MPANPACSTCLEDTGAKTLKYFYDFGDGWEHTVKVERIADAVPGLLYPILIDGTGRCPPEDVGGPWGYTDLLEALGDLNHARHAEVVEWLDGAFDPLSIDIEQHEKAVATLARKWSRKPTAKPKKIK